MTHMLSPRQSRPARRLVLSQLQVEGITHALYLLSLDQQSFLRRVDHMLSEPMVKALGALHRRIAEGELGVLSSREDGGGEVEIYLSQTSLDLLQDCLEGTRHRAYVTAPKPDIFRLCVTFGDQLLEPRPC